MAAITATGTPSTTNTRKALLAMLAGFGLTVAGTAYAVIDALTTSRLTDHIRAAYPAWSQSDVDADKLAIVIYLVTFGVLGAITWLWSAWVVNKEKPWARVAVTTAFIVGTGLAMMGATMSGDAYDQIVPTPYGIATMIPSLAGLAAVWFVWKRDD